MSEEHSQDLADFVEETIRTLYDKGIAAADLAPLVKLHDAVKSTECAIRRAGEPCCASHSRGAGNRCRASRIVQAYRPI